MSADEALGQTRSPISQNKYLYADADPSNSLDPAGLMTLGDVGAALDIRGILTNIAKDQVSGYVQRRVFGDDDGPVDGPPNLYEILIGQLVQAVADSLSESGAVATAVTLAFTSGPTEGHHVIPEYMCGAKQQELVGLSLPAHDELHRRLQNFVYAVKIGALTYDILLRHRWKTEDISPIGKLARTKLGRSEIVAALTAFYGANTYRGTPWLAQGRGRVTGLPLGGVLLIEGTRFIAGHHNYPACKKQ